MLHNSFKHLHRIKIKFISHIKIIFIKCVLLFRSYPLEESMMIVGEPRSGTTWLMKLLANYRKCIIVWEPLHPFFGVSPTVEARVFEDPSSAHSSISQELINILTLKKVNNWTLVHTTFISLIRGRCTLVKFVHGTLLLPWMVTHLQLKHKPIYIIRHPVAVVLSQLKSGMDTAREMVSNKTFHRMYPSHYEKFQKFINTLNNEMEKLIAMWCMYHKYLIAQLSKDDRIILIYYEELLMYPAKELKKICAAWSINLDIDAQNFREPSETDFHKQFKEDPHEQLTKWQHQLSTFDKYRVQSILDFFEIKLYNVNDVYPNKTSS